jgi:hypothetical protein
VTAVAGKSQSLAIVGYNFDCHMVVVDCIRATKKPVGEDGRVVGGRLPCEKEGNRALPVKLEAGLLRLG